MKKLLLVGSLAILSLALSCQRKSGAQQDGQQKVSEDVVVIKHGDPEQAKLDSMVEAKTKAKRKQLKDQ